MPRNGELKSSLAWQWLPAAGGDGAWEARTVSGQMLMCGDIFAASLGGAKITAFVCHGNVVNMRWSV
jgi:hypothetical protein